MLTVEEGIGQELCASSLDLILGGQQSVILLFISVAAMSRKRRNLVKKGGDSWYCGQEVWWMDMYLNNLGGAYLWHRHLLVRWWTYISLSHHYTELLVLEWDVNISQSFQMFLMLISWHVIRSMAADVWKEVLHTWYISGPFINFGFWVFCIIR